MRIGWKLIIVLVPIFSILVEIIDYFFNDYISLVRGGVLVILVAGFFVSRNKIKIDIIAYSIIAFLVYTTLLIFKSSDFTGSVLSQTSVFVSMSFYIMSYNVYKNENDIQLFNYVVKLIPILFLFNLVIYSYLRIGEGIYGGSLHFGNLHNNAIYTASLVVMIGIVFPSHMRNNWLNIFGIVILMAIILISFRRTAIILVIVGIVIYFILAKKKDVVKYVLPTIFLLIITFPLYGDYLINTMTARGGRATFEQGIERESRFREMALINSKIFSFEDTNYSLFGIEYLNSPGTYATSQFPAPSTRPLHTDYARVLHGSGIIGILLYGLIILLIIYKSFFIIRKIGFRDKKSIMLVILCSWIILLTMSGSILSIGFRITYFILLGMLMGISNNENLVHNSSIEH